MQIERQAIADVHAGGGEADQFAAEFQARGDLWFLTPTTEGSRNIKQISWFCARSAESLAFGCGAAEHDVAHQLIGMREVAASELGFSLAQLAINAPIEIIDPRLCRPGPERE